MNLFRKTISLILVLVLLGSMVPAGASGAQWQCPFQDVPEDAYYFEAVRWAVENGITSGVSPTQFAPGRNCTRGQVVTFLWRAAGSPEPDTASNPFSDVDEGQYYFNPILWAVENNITQGVGSGRFAPEQQVTRGQFVTFLWRAAGQPEPQDPAGSFQDVAPGAYYCSAVLWAAENGITAGVRPGAFAPDSPCTRAQVVTFLFRGAKLEHIHDYAPAVTPPTCTEDGYTVYSCACGDSYTGDDTDALGHEFGAGVVTLEPTEETEGLMSYTCLRCDEVKTEPIPKLEHTHRYSPEIIAPTCTESGYTVYTCTCGDSYTGDDTEALGHEFGAGVVTLEPTEETEGLMSYACLRCGEVKTDPISKLEHIHRYSPEIIAPTCTEGGYTVYTCTCGDSYTGDDTEALGHEFGEGVVTLEPTEEAEGEMTSTCLRCDEVKTELIPRLEHTHGYIREVIPPTCTASGYSHFVCDCGDAFIKDFVDPIPHQWDDGTVTQKPTASAEGTMLYTCTGCDATRTESIPKLDHPEFGIHSLWGGYQSSAWQDAVQKDPTSLPVYNGEHTFEDALAILEAMNPDGAMLARTAGGESFMFWYFDHDTLTSAMEGAIHESYHRVAHSKWFRTTAYLEDGWLLDVPETEVFLSEEMTVLIAPEYRTFRFQDYVGTGSDLSSNQSGIYGLLNEFNAYQSGMHQGVSMFEYYAVQKQSMDLWGEFFSCCENNRLAYAEFRYYILTYLIYAKDHYPQIYAELLENTPLRYAFSVINDNFERDIALYESCLELLSEQQVPGQPMMSITDQFIWFDESGYGRSTIDYRILMTAMKQTQYKEILKEFRIS